MLKTAASTKKTSENLTKVREAPMSSFYWKMIDRFDGEWKVSAHKTILAASNPVDILKAQSFKKCSPIAFKSILKLNHMNCSETDVLAGAITWATEPCQQFLHHLRIWELNWKTAVTHPVSNYDLNGIRPMYRKVCVFNGLRINRIYHLRLTKIFD